MIDSKNVNIKNRINENNILHENKNIFKFSEKISSTTDIFSEKLKNFLKNTKNLTKCERINFLSTSLGVSLGINNFIKD